MVKYRLFLTPFVSLSLFGLNISNSFYGGANLGFNVISGKRSDTSEARVPIEQTTLADNKGISKRGASGGIFAG